MSINLTENGLAVLQKRILQGQTPVQRFHEVAATVAGAEKDIERGCWKDTFYNALATLQFLPNSPCLVNAGRPLGQLAACFVLPIEDSMDGIFTTIHDMAMIQKSGGGTGFSFSRLRSANESVSSTQGKASGPVSFMHVFNAATDAVKQGGIRRGANMAILRVDHPDILQFIMCKDDTSVLTNFNISVGVTKKFMEAVKNKTDYDLMWNGEVKGQLYAPDVFDKLAHQSWKNGEPGVVFLDTINDNNPITNQQVEATNPCGEQPLLPYECCDLGSINLVAMLTADEDAADHQLDEDESRYQIDWPLLRQTVETGVRFLDDVISVNHYPLGQIAQNAQDNRKIGLGIMGFADILYQLRIPYNSKQAIDLAAKIMKFITEAAQDYSKVLGREKGNFPNINNSVFWENGGQVFRRNATCTTIAPTGTLSMIADVSSGIEPNFSLAYTKTVIDGTPFRYVNRPFLEFIKQYYPADQHKGILDYVEKTGTCQGAPFLSPFAQSLFVTSRDLQAMDHVAMQAAFQQFTDNAVSKTINFANQVTVEELENAIINAYELGCKGLTCYRDGSRSSQPIKTGTKDKPADTVVPVLERRPVELSGVTRQIRTGCGTMFVTVNVKDGHIYEVFLKAGSSGGCAAFTEETARLISIGLRYGISVDEIIDQLQSAKCTHFLQQAVRNKNLTGKSCPDAVGRVLKDTQAKLTGKPAKPKDPIVDTDTLYAEGAPYETCTVYHCPECGAELQEQEGCLTCHSCGYSKC